MDKTKITLAVLGNEINHIKEKQIEQSEGIKNILTILTEGEGKIASLRADEMACRAKTTAYLKVNNNRISRLEKVMLGTVSALLMASLGVLVTYVF